MPRKPFVGGNWKSNGTVDSARALCASLTGAGVAAWRNKVDVVISPIAPQLGLVGKFVKKSLIRIASQNVSASGEGAFTGEISAGQLKDAGIQWTLVGHSERRTKYGETDAITADKVEKCQAAGVGVIFCIGEQLSERESGKTDEVNKRQVDAVLDKIKDWKKVVIAYEPVWAIGTGKVATPEQAQDAHAAIRKLIASSVSEEVANAVRIIYGGSVTPENAKDLIAKPDIDGFLVGGASLKPTFTQILAAAGPSAMTTSWPKYQEKLEKEGLNESAIKAFKYNYRMLVCKSDMMIPESKLDPVDSLPDYESLKVKPDPKLLKQTVILKLNGGLGTGMGLEKAKSLLEVTEGNTFLDLIAKQVESMKSEFKVKNLKFMLMNSFATSKDTLEALSKYSDLGTGDDLEFVQNKAPKVTAADFTPASWPAEPSHEWCPPGHGDLYPAMLGSGTLERLLAKGFKYMFVSNSDNLGATMDLTLLTHFVKSKAPFMMEVATRTDADKKGGHLARDVKTGGLLLRESAQCPDEDEKAFQDVTKYKFFNTNNLWLDLQALKRIFEKHGGCIPLPVMKNSKTVDPRDKASTAVLQLETAMGAALSCFEGATAIVVPRERFAPVKTTNDLLALRSDAYQLTKDYRITLDPARKGVPPNIKLDGRYKFVDAMETMIPEGAPSLLRCTSLAVHGEVAFAKGVVFIGDVIVKNGDEGLKTLAAGTYGSDTAGVPAVIEL